MAKAEISSGVCGFTATVRAKRDGRKVRLEIVSDCDAVQALAEELTEVEPFQEISFRGEGPKTLAAGHKYCHHPACPVPVGIIKAIEVEAGLALPAEAKIELSKDDE
ncbi:MAG: hypothetical protein AB8I80_10115 [Anaerolineae bacterium]